LGNDLRNKPFDMLDYKGEPQLSAMHTLSFNNFKRTIQNFGGPMNASVAIRPGVDAALFDAEGGDRIALALRNPIEQPGTTTHALDAYTPIIPEDLKPYNPGYLTSADAVNFFYTMGETKIDPAMVHTLENYMGDGTFIDLEDYVGQLWDAADAMREEYPNAPMYEIEDALIAIERKMSGPAVHGGFAKSHANSEVMRVQQLYDEMTDALLPPDAAVRNESYYDSLKSMLKMHGTVDAQQFAEIMDVPVEPVKQYLDTAARVGEVARGNPFVFTAANDALAAVKPDMSVEARLELYPAIWKAVKEVSLGDELHQITSRELQYKQHVPTTESLGALTTALVDKMESKGIPLANENVVHIASAIAENLTQPTYYTTAMDRPEQGVPRDLAAQSLSNRGATYTLDEFAKYHLGEGHQFPLGDNLPWESYGSASGVMSVHMHTTDQAREMAPKMSGLCIGKKIRSGYGRLRFCHHRI
jgi:hypothetical protein